MKQPAKTPNTKNLAGKMIADIQGLGKTIGGITLEKADTVFLADFFNNQTAVLQKDKLPFCLDNYSPCFAAIKERFSASRNEDHQYKQKYAEEILQEIAADPSKLPMLGRYFMLLNEISLALLHAFYKQARNYFSEKEIYIDGGIGAEWWVYDTMQAAKGYWREYRLDIMDDREAFSQTQSHYEHINEVYAAAPNGFRYFVDTQYNDFYTSAYSAAVLYNKEGDEKSFFELNDHAACLFAYMTYPKYREALLDATKATPAIKSGKKVASPLLMQYLKDGAFARELGEDEIQLLARWFAEPNVLAQDKNNPTHENKSCLARWFMQLYLLSEGKCNLLNILAHFSTEYFGTSELIQMARKLYFPKETEKNRMQIYNQLFASYPVKELVGEIYAEAEKKLNDYGGTSTCECFVDETFLSNLIQHGFDKENTIIELFTAAYRTYTLSDKNYEVRLNELLYLLIGKCINAYPQPQQEGLKKELIAEGYQSVVDNLNNASPGTTLKLKGAACKALLAFFAKHYKQSGYLNLIVNYPKKYYSRVIDEIKERTTIPMLKLTTEKTGTPLSPYASKFGGTPYLPQGFDYPQSTHKKGPNNPLKLLAQLNFEELPHIPDFPTKGMLQFYLDPQDDMLGYNNDKNSYRIVYHADINKDETLLQSPPEIEVIAGFPVEGEFALHGSVEQCPMTLSDDRFDDLFLEVYKKHFKPAKGKRITDLYDIDDAYDILFDDFSNPEHCCGGYPNFSQDDPREEDSRYNTLLLQIDTEDGIQWGDMGTANFFINLEDLKKLDFSDVLYNWDCS